MVSIINKPKPQEAITAKASCLSCLGKNNKGQTNIPIRKDNKAICESVPLIKNT